MRCLTTCSTACNRSSATEPSARRKACGTCFDVAKGSAVETEMPSACNTAATWSARTSGGRTSQTKYDAGWLMSVSPARALRAMA